VTICCKYTRINRMKIDLDDLDSRNDLVTLKSRFVKPALLLHGPIPAPLHGVSPRTMLGKTWWEAERRQAYRENRYHCWACGVHKSNAKGKRKILEAHEIYKFNYKEGSATYLGACALCRYCHGFIHIGRLIMLWEDGDASKGEVTSIINHGLEILQTAELVPHPASWLAADELGIDIDWCDPPAELDTPKRGADPKKKWARWADWRLIVGKREFKGKFASKEQWKEHYK